jgi:hypothetical protein
MQKEIKKIMSLSVLVFSMVLLAGCGGGNNQSSINTNIPKTAVPNANTVKNNVDANTPSVATPDTANLPAPTGKVDDTVNAIVDGAGKENAQVSSDEGDAKAAVDNSTNSQAANDLGAGL